MIIEEILETMDGFLDKSSTVPFSNKKMVDVEQMHEYIDSIRLNMPSEIKRAKDMAREKKSIIDDANKEAETVISKAKEEAKRLVSEQEIIRQATEYAKQQLQKAEAEANSIIAQAQDKDKAIREALAANLNTTLVEAADVLSRSLKSVNDTRDAVSKIGTNGSKPAPKTAE